MNVITVVVSIQIKLRIFFFYQIGMIFLHIEAPLQEIKACSAGGKQVTYPFFARSESKSQLLVGPV